MKFKELCEELEQQFQDSYENGTSLADAEKLAVRFLYAQTIVSKALKEADLDARMRKSGVKAIRAAVYLDIVQKADKKPTEAQIAAMVDTDSIVSSEQKEFDVAEVSRDYLERYCDIFKQAHYYYQSISKGKFE